MTAVLHTIELFIPGTVTSSKTSQEYRVRRSAVPVTLAERRRIAKAITNQQRMWSLLVIAAGLLYGLMVVYSARQRGIDVEVQREALRPIMIAGIAVLGYLQVHFGGQRRFALSAPFAIAEVVEEDISPEESGESAAHHLALRYMPLPAKGATEQYTMLDGPSVIAGWADMDGFTERFEGTVHVGDFVSVLYDPSNPAHIRVVEG